LQGWSLLPEARLPDGHRADLMGLSPRGEVLIVEVKVSAGDLRGDRKWSHYLDWCDHFAWAVPQALGPLLDTPAFRPDVTGLIVTDAHEAAMLRPPAPRPLAPARRKALHLMLARLGAERAMRGADPGFFAGLPLG
jgi:hypothetical protein